MNTLSVLKLANERGAREQLNKIAIAFILTEMKFRGPFIRACEMLCAAWTIYVLRHEPKLTVGKCQVEFGYWRRRYGQNNLTLLLAMLDDTANYDVCCDYLTANAAPTLKDTLIRYNGRPSELYVRLFYKHLTICNSTIVRANILAKNFLTVRTGKLAGRAI